MRERSWSKQLLHGLVFSSAYPLPVCTDLNGNPIKKERQWQGTKRKARIYAGKVVLFPFQIIGYFNIFTMHLNIYYV
jgi:hypothetical protein